MNFKRGQQIPLEGGMANWSTWYGSFFTGVVGPYPLPFRDSLGVDKKVYELYNYSIVGVVNTSVKAAWPGGWLPAYEQSDPAKAALWDAVVEQFTAFAAINNNLTWTDAYVLGTGNYSFYHYDLVAGLMGAIYSTLQGTWWNIEMGYPTKAGHLISTLVSGQPIYVPEGDYMDFVVDDYNINDEVLTRIPYVEGTYDLNLDGAISAVPQGTL